jgi:hypothetical protein
MRRSILATFAALALIAVTVGGSRRRRYVEGAAAVHRDHNVYDIGKRLRPRVADVPVLRVFMETGSASENCLVTLGEANHAPPWRASSVLPNAHRYGPGSWSR